MQNRITVHGEMLLCGVPTPAKVVDWGLIWTSSEVAFP
jgi:hypothetical protein